MEILVYVILGIVVLGIIMFKTDRKQLSESIAGRGGLKTMFPNFVFYCESPMTLYPDREMELVKDSGEYLEYKVMIAEDGVVYGYFHYGIRHSFGTLLYSHFVTRQGRKINGYSKDITNSTGIYELTYEEYNRAFEGMVRKISGEKEFQKYLNGFL